jgi:hypothetical protein
MYQLCIHDCDKKSETNTADSRLSVLGLTMGLYNLLVIMGMVFWVYSVESKIGLQLWKTQDTE